MKAVWVWPPSRTKFCCCETPLEEFEVDGSSGVMVSPASGMGGPLDGDIDSVYMVLEEDEGSGVVVSMLLEYVALLTQSDADVVVLGLGHMPPKVYISASATDAVGEKERPADRKSMPRVESSEDKDSCAHEPLALPLVTPYLHNCAPWAP